MPYDKALLVLVGQFFLQVLPEYLLYERVYVFYAESNVIVCVTNLNVLRLKFRVDV